MARCDLPIRPARLERLFPRLRSYLVMALTSDRARSVVAEVANFRGWLQTREPFLLWGIAASLPRGAHCVEIGSFEGKSSRVIASALADGGSLSCVDPFTGSPEHQELLDGASTFDAFRRNVAPFIDTGVIKVFRCTSDQAVDDVAQHVGAGGVDFLWIDGDHSYDQVRRDAENYLPLLGGEGIVAFHDTLGSGFSGPTRVVVELLNRSDLQFLGVVQSISVFRRCPNGSFGKLFGKSHFWGACFVQWLRELRGGQERVRNS